MEIQTKGGKAYTLFPTTFKPKVMVDYYLNFYSRYPITVRQLTEESAATVVEVSQHVQDWLVFRFNYVFICC
jgi:hypothetical protein